jgi:hypothetical protein
MQKRNIKRKAVIVGCARDCEIFLPAVLKNITRIANLYSQAAFVFVENDSTDNTRDILQNWLGQHANSLLVCLDGLLVQETRRTVRLAIARNAYMEALRPHLDEFDHMVVLDFDNVNCNVISEESLEEAIEFLDSSRQNAAVFANQLRYYDIWALRHDVWCPEDCWSKIMSRPAYLPLHRAVERYVTSRQISIHPSTPPVAVRSAFGGLAIYKSDFVRTARYVGVLSDGSEICEHVAFNGEAVRGGGLLHIFPKLVNQVPQDHINQRLSGLRRLAADLDLRSYKFYSTLSPALRRCKRLLCAKAPAN